MCPGSVSWLQKHSPVTSSPRGHDQRSLPACTSCTHLGCYTPVYATHTYSRQVHTCTLYVHTHVRYHCLRNVTYPSVTEVCLSCSRARRAQGRPVPLPLWGEPAAWPTMATDLSSPAMAVPLALHSLGLSESWHWACISSWRTCGHKPGWPHVKDQKEAITDTSDLEIWPPPWTTVDHCMILSQTPVS